MGAEDIRESQPLMIEDEVNSDFNRPKRQLFWPRLLTPLLFINAVLMLLVAVCLATFIFDSREGEGIVAKSGCFDGMSVDANSFVLDHV